MRPPAMRPAATGPSRRAFVSAALASAAAGPAALFGCRKPSAAAAAPRELVLYCATDREVAQDLIDLFGRESGVRVRAKFDTEAAKAVGLVQAVRQERGRPRCDVLWGGGAFFQTILAGEGCLVPAPPDLVRSLGPTAPHDARGRWLGFAGVYRVLIVNTDALPDPAARPRSYRDLADPAYKGRVGVANPLFGGMAAHAAALFAKLGDAGGRAWLSGLRHNDVAVCAGMADVRNRVASGELWVGLTSTVDAHAAVAGGKPVAVVYPDQGPGGVGCLNGHSAVGLVAGGPNPREAEALVRFLLTPRAERMLAAGPGQYVGMLPGSVAEDVRPAWIPAGVRSMDVDWTAAVAAHPAATAAVKEILLAR